MADFGQPQEMLAEQLPSGEVAWNQPSRNFLREVKDASRFARDDQAQTVDVGQTAMDPDAPATAQLQLPVAGRRPNRPSTSPSSTATSVSHPHCHCGPKRGSAATALPVSLAARRAASRRRPRGAPATAATVICHPRRHPSTRSSVLPPRRPVRGCRLRGLTTARRPPSVSHDLELASTAVGVGGAPRRARRLGGARDLRCATAARGAAVRARGPISAAAAAAARGGRSCRAPPTRAAAEMPPPPCRRRRDDAAAAHHTAGSARRRRSPARRRRARPRRRWRGRPRPGAKAVCTAAAAPRATQLPRARAARRRRARRLGGGSDPRASERATGGAVAARGAAARRRAAASTASARGAALPFVRRRRRNALRAPRPRPGRGGGALRALPASPTCGGARARRCAPTTAARARAGALLDRDAPTRTQSSSRCSRGARAPTATAPHAPTAELPSVQAVRAAELLAPRVAPRAPERLVLAYRSSSAVAADAGLLQPCRSACCCRRRSSSRARRSRARRPPRPRRRPLGRAAPDDRAAALEPALLSRVGWVVAISPREFFAYARSCAPSAVQTALSMLG